jgi:CIC family chloride channel protein
MLKRQHKPLLDTVLLGVVGALGAQVFTFLLKLGQTVLLSWLAGYRPPVLTSDGSVGALALGVHGLRLIPLATTLGGLLSGVIVYSLAPEAEGHGTEAVVKAFHNLGGVIRTRAPFVKLVASATTIGSAVRPGGKGRPL